MGSYKSAKSWLDNKISPRLANSSSKPILNVKQATFVNKIVTAINEAYSAHKAEYDEEDRLKKEKEEAERKKKKEEEEAKKKEAPYKGMSESKIDSTDLGKHSEYFEHFNYVHDNGNIYSASMYYWKKNGDLIFSARCVEGKVWNVTDYRDEVDSKAKKSTTSSSTKKTTKSSSKKSYKQEKTVDPDDHDIDAYYEDYKDDFEDEDDAWDDFEDNEEYWDDY